MKTKILADLQIYISVPLKVHKCRSENLLALSSLYKNNAPMTSRYNTFYFLGYAHPRYIKCLFTNIRKQQNMSNISQIFKENGNFVGK